MIKQFAFFCQKIECAITTIKLLNYPKDIFFAHLSLLFSLFLIFFLQILCHHKFFNFLFHHLIHPNKPC